MRHNKIPHLQNRSTPSYFSTFLGSLEQSLWLGVGGFQMLFWSVSQAGTAHSAASQIATLLMLLIQQNKFSCSLWWSLRMKGSRTSPFCFLLSQELGLCYAKDLFALHYWKYKKILGTRNSRFSLRVRMLPLQSRKSSFQHPWHDENMPFPLPSHSSFHSASQRLPRTINLLLFYPHMDLVWRRIIFRRIMRDCL